jgi:hypothetical protein
MMRARPRSWNGTRPGARMAAPQSAKADFPIVSGGFQPAVIYPPRNERGRLTDADPPGGAPAIVPGASNGQIVAFANPIQWLE